MPIEMTRTGDMLMYSVTGWVEKTDVEHAMQLLNEAKQQDGDVHVLVDVCNFEGMSLGAWLNDLRHAPRNLAQIHRFGRIAIVSDVSWVRMASKIESELLPFISLKVYKPDEREHALAWVKGEISSPRP